MNKKANQPIIRRVASVMLVALSATMSVSAIAAEKNTPRRPLRAQEQRTSTLELSRYDKPYRIERMRTEMKKSAVFHAEPQEIQDNAILLIEISSVSRHGNTPRWRCVAVEDVAECLGSAVKLRYLDDDEKMVLTVTAKPRNTPEALALIQETKRALPGTALTSINE